MPISFLYIDVIDPILTVRVLLSTIDRLRVYNRSLMSQPSIVHGSNIDPQLCQIPRSSAAEQSEWDHIKEWMSREGVILRKPQRTWALLVNPPWATSLPRLLIPPDYALY
ncbi:hypothetical protein J6590_083308 [Homalodisca vitripennis]|nr:hypothetical protein J6590_083308 [Homalodisca vitripennis]